MVIDTTELFIHFLFQYPITPLVVDMPEYKKRSTQHEFCPLAPAQYWIDWRKEEETSWRRAQPLGKVYKKQPDMKLLYDPIEKKLEIHVRNPVKSAGKYNIIFSPNDWLEWSRFPLIVCYVDEPTKMFLPEDYNLKFRPEEEARRYDLPHWPVIGGS